MGTMSLTQKAIITISRGEGENNVKVEWDFEPPYRTEDVPDPKDSVLRCASIMLKAAKVPTED